MFKKKLEVQNWGYSDIASKWIVIQVEISAGMLLNYESLTVI